MWCSAQTPPAHRGQCVCRAELVAGAIAAAVFLRAMFGTAGHLGASLPGAGIHLLQALFMEVLLTPVS